MLSPSSTTPLYSEKPSKRSTAPTNEQPPHTTNHLLQISLLRSFDLHGEPSDLCNPWND